MLGFYSLGGAPLADIDFTYSNEPVFSIILPFSVSIQNLSILTSEIDIFEKFNGELQKNDFSTTKINKYVTVTSEILGYVYLDVSILTVDSLRASFAKNNRFAFSVDSKIYETTEISCGSRSSSGIKKRDISDKVI